jgi:hypothetical protein
MGNVVFVFGPSRRVTVSREDAWYLAESWLKGEASRAGMRLRGGTQAALETGEVRMTDGMREVLLAVLEAVDKVGHLNTEGLVALREEARTPVEFPPE